MNFFKLKKVSKCCEQCKEPFAGSAISVLSDDRVDFCPSCFAQNPKPPIWWKTTIEPKVNPILMTAYEKQLYDQLVEAIEQKTKSDEWVYFLAHYFKRRKVLHSQGECEKGEILECKLSQEVYVVPKTPPSNDSLKEIVEELNNVQSP